MNPLPHLAIMRGFARKLTQDGDLAEDLLQDACLRLLQNETYDPNHPSGTTEAYWACAVVKTEWLKWFKRQRALKRDRCLEWQVPHTNGDDEPYDNEAALSVAPRQEEQIYIAEVIALIRAKLTRGQSKALIDYINGVPERSQRTTVITARKALRKLVA